MDSYQTFSPFCFKCGKPLGTVYYVVDNQPWCQECYLKFQKETAPSYAQGWICPRCGRVNSPYVSQCPCSPTIRTTITYC